jgi:hypothetical protein
MKAITKEKERKKFGDPVQGLYIKGDSINGFFS